MESTSISTPIARSRTRSIAFVALTIAIMAVSAWVTIPIGPIPFTLQMFAIPFAIVVLSPKQAIAAIAGYLILGAIGVPVFSGMRGGFGVLAGPTGGFLWGYIFGVVAAAFFLQFVRTHTSWGASRAELACAAAQDPAAIASLSMGARIVRFFRMAGVEVVAGVIFTALAYVCGCIQYMALMNVGVEVAFMACCAPFIVLDLIKIVAAVLCAQAVKGAVRA